MQSLTLMGLGLVPHYPELSHRPLTPVLKTLNSLELSSSKLLGKREHRSSIILQFIHLFSSISELVLDNFWLDPECEEGKIFSSDYDVSPSDTPPAFQVHSLSVTRLFDSMLIFQIIKRTSAKCLRKLDTPIPRELSALQNLINETSPQLSELALPMDDKDYQSGFGKSAPHPTRSS